MQSALHVEGFSPLDAWHLLSPHEVAVPQAASAPPFSPEHVHDHEEGLPLSGKTLIFSGETTGPGKPTVLQRFDVGFF